MSMNKNKFIFLSLIILIVSWFIGMDVHARVCSYVDQEGNLEASITIETNKKAVMGKASKFWDIDTDTYGSVLMDFKKKDFEIHNDDDNKVDDYRCPKYLLAYVYTASNTEKAGVVVYFHASDSKEDLEIYAKEKKLLNQDNDLIGFNKNSAEKDVSENKEGKKVKKCNYDSIDGCNNCSVNLDFFTSETEVGLGNSVLASYTFSGDITGVNAIGEGWKIDNVENTALLYHPFNNIEYYCPSDLYFSYNVRSKVLSIYVNKEDYEKEQNKANEFNVDVKTDDTIVGEGFCNEEATKKVLSLVGYLLVVVKIAVPLILIVIGTVDLMQAVTGKDDKSLSKSLKTLLLRVLLGVLIFFVPTIVNVVFDIIYEVSGTAQNNQCISCVLEPGNCK